MVDFVGYPAGTRIVRQRGSAQFLEVRHRGHGTVEDTSSAAPTRLRPLPIPPLPRQRRLAQLSLAAIDLLARTRVLLLDSDLATAEPKKLRYRIPIGHRLEHRRPRRHGAKFSSPSSPQTVHTSGMPRTATEVQQFTDAERPAMGHSGTEGRMTGTAPPQGTHPGGEHGT